MAALRRFLKFLAVGSFFATVEEFLTIVVLKHQVGAYVFTLLILFPIFLTFVWFSSWLLRWVASREASQELVHFFLYGCVGLAIEWFVIGLSPWSNPDANPVLMLLFQMGMFSFWATVAFAPRLFVGPTALHRRTSKFILKFYLPYFLVVYLLAMLAPADWKFVTIIGLIVAGYVVLNFFYLWYFIQAFSSADAPAAP